VPTSTRRAVRHTTLALDTHPYLKDHAVPNDDKGSMPVFPLASAATLLAETALTGTFSPFEVRDLRLFQGVAVKDPVALEATTTGENAEIRQGEKRILSYAAKVSLWTSADLPEVPAPLKGGDAPSLPLARFYGGITFHGPLLQGITAIDGVGPDFIRGKVRTSKPAQWVKAQALGGQHRWAIDPLAFDAAMQLAAYVAWVRFQRAGTPVGFARWVQLRDWPDGEVIAEARFNAADTDRLEANLVFRTLSGEPIALAEQVAADMKKVDASRLETLKAAPEPEFKPKPEWTDPAQWRGYKDLAMRLQAVSAMGLKNPYFDVHEGTARNTSQIGGREVVNFSSYNYIGLSGDERVLTEVFDAIRKYGTSVSASRVASGERPFHRELEAELAAAHGCEDALVMAGGHATNVNTIGHIFGGKDLILHDELIHDSCLQGIKLSGAARRSFKHEDIADLERQLVELRRHYEKVLILVEGVYSMDGDITNLPEYVRLKKAHATMLMVDEAHSFGTIGKRGCGVGEHFGMDDPNSPERAQYGLVRRDVDIWMGTMSKSLSSMGGWVAGRKELMTYLRYTTPGFVFAAGIPPALGQAALSSLRYMLKEPERVARLQANSKRFWELLTERGIDTGPARGDSPVIPVITGDSMWALKLSERLLDLGVSASSIEAGERGPGINAKPIIFPAVANDAARLRFFMTSLHTEEQLVHTADAIKRTLDQIRAEAPKKPAPKKA
jgi:7-keto-8-aminopelargonate synthetase-like enzyme